MAAELNVAETIEKELECITRVGWHVEFRIVKTGYGSVGYGCSTDDVMKGLRSNKGRGQSGGG